MYGTAAGLSAVLIAKQFSMKMSPVVKLRLLISNYN